MPSAARARCFAASVRHCQIRDKSPLHGAASVGEIGVAPFRQIVRAARTTSATTACPTVMPKSGRPGSAKLVQERATVGLVRMPIEGPEADGTSELAHEQFDKLAGIDPANRIDDSCA